MKIKVTEIEANAEELKTCNTLSQNLNMLLTRAFAPATRHVAKDDDESTDYPDDYFEMSKDEDDEK